MPPTQIATPDIVPALPQAASQPHAYPVRDYIGAMADELARLARFDGDEVLAVILEAAANRAAVASSAN